MKYFKIKASRTAKRYKINKENFNIVTGRKFPFEQKSLSGKLNQYGVCPSCLNPIQLIGLSKEIKYEPHGKHTGKYINGLPKWNQMRYEYCPYAKRNEYKAPDDNDLLNEIDEGVVELYNLLKENFDRVVYVIQKELHIRCSDVFWRDALKQYVVNQIYCYPWLTEANLPYVFALRGMQQKNCFKQKFEIDSEIYNELKKHPNIQFDDIKFHSGKVDEKYKFLNHKNECFMNLVFRFTAHQQNAVDGQTLKESMLFCIDDNVSTETIYERRIEFDESYFMNIINSENAEKYRVQKYLDIANECMSPLQA